MSEFTRTLQNIVDLSDEEKIAMAVDSYKELYDKICKFDDEPDSDGHYTTMILLAGIIGADGELDSYEASIVSSIMSALGYDIPESRLPEIMKGLLEGLNVYEIMSNFMGTLNDDERASLAVMAAAICSIDDKLTKNEIALISDLLE